MLKIKVVTDSGADLTLEEEKALGLDVVRLPITIDDKEYLEAVDIERDSFIKKMREGATVKTSQPSIGEITRVWDKALLEAEELIYVPVSSKLSGSYANAFMLAKEEYKGRVTVLDIKQVCYPQQHVCKEIQKAIDLGMTVQEIKTLFEEQSQLWAVLIPGDIIYLKRGGRISSSAAALANLLKIFPILKVEDGAIDVYDKVRTAKKAYQIGIDACLKDIQNKEDYAWYIVDGDAMDVSLKLQQDIFEKYQIKPEIVAMHPVIMSHTGPGTFCFGRVKRIIK